MLKQYRLRDYNFRLVLWVLALSVIGILLVGSAKASLQPRQTIGVIAGAVMMIIVSMFDFSWILNFYWILYVLNLGMLAAVLVFGNSSHGAQRWISIGGFTFQPAELSKIILIIFFAQYFMKHENDLNKPKIFIRSVLLIILPLALIIAQPDLKDTIIIFLLFAIMYFIAGLSLKTIGIILAIVIPAAVIFLFAVTQTDSSGNGLLKSYQRQRIMAFLNPNDSEYSDDSTQQDNSVIAQLAVSDMRIPIQYALTWPMHLPSPAAELDFAQMTGIEIGVPDDEVFRGLPLARQAIRTGGSMPCVFNAANEWANAWFRKGKISFLQIYDIIEETMAAHHVIADPSVEDILAIEAEVDARCEEVYGK